jgi:hypothetical protein
VLEGLPPCACRIHAPVGDEAAWTADDRKLVADVEGHGWHLVGINPQPGQPSWVFSVGLWHTFRSPELSMFGLRMMDMGQWINRAGEQVREGRPPQPDEVREGVLEGFSIQWRPAHESWYHDLFGYGLWFYQGWFPVLQMVWPDRHGLFPWEEGCGDRCRLDQPVLWRPAEEHPLGQWRRGPKGLEWLWPDPPDRRVFLTKRTTAHGAAIVYVVHEPDGDWQFLDGGNVGKDEIAIAHLGDVASRFPELNELAELPLGWQAWRKSPTDAWHREPAP